MIEQPNELRGAWLLILFALFYTLANELFEVFYENKYLQLVNENQFWAFVQKDFYEGVIAGLVYIFTIFLCLYWVTKYKYFSYITTWVSSFFCGSSIWKMLVISWHSCFLSDKNTLFSTWGNVEKYLSDPSLVIGSKLFIGTIIVLIMIFLTIRLRNKLLDHTIE